MGFKFSNIAWLETLVLAIVAIIVWYITDTRTLHNSGQASFFWSSLGPLIVALRYGFAKGFICALITVVVCIAISNLSASSLSFSFSNALGICLLAMIAGEFRDYWHKTNEKYKQNHDYMAKRINSFTQNYHLLKVSHDQLEQKTAAATVNLRASMQSLHTIAAKHDQHQLEELAIAFLDLFAEIGGVEVAGIYRVEDDNLQENVLAELGDTHALDIDDPMLLDMLKRKKLLSIGKFATNHQDQSRYQLCIPFVDTNNKLQAVILVEKVKFFMLTKVNIALLSVLANYAADLVSSDAITPHLEPNQGKLFLQYLMRAIENRDQFGTDSSMLLCIDRSGKHKKALDHAVNFRRGADIYWNCWHKEPDAVSIPAIAVLLPLTALIDAQQYVLRLEDLLKNELGDEHKYIEIIGPFSLSSHWDVIEQMMEKLGEYNADIVDFSLSR